MSKHEILAPNRPWRRSKVRRLVFRPPAGGNASESKGATGRWRDSRDWQAIKEQLRITVRRAPEVLINVKGSRRSKDGDHAAIEGVLRYMMYISRNGRLLTTNERDERLEGLDAIREAHAAWDLDMQRMRGAKDASLHPAFNMIFSMPAKTDPEKLLEAVSAVAQTHFAGHQYVMAVHTQETDPADDPPAHPHVHLVLRAEDENGQRIHIRKTDLRVWREQFASELRARGIDANATSRAERGRAGKSISGPEWHLQKRYDEALLLGKSSAPPKARAARFLEAARELQEGRTEEKPWEIAMAARRRDVSRELLLSVVRLRGEGENELAEQVDQFMREMDPLDSERRRMQRAMLKQVHERLRERDKEKDDYMPE